jgi:hypothetical protein
MSVKVRYKDVAIGADKDATVTTTAKTAFSDTSKIPFGVNPPALATCELNGWGLSHNYKARSNHAIAFWSNTQSGDDCKFSSMPTITLEFTEQYTTTGLTIQFAVNSVEFCRKLAVYWYQDGEVKEQGIYTPTSPNFVLNKTVEAFDKLVFEFLETNLPRKRCKVEGIIIGVIGAIIAFALTSWGYMISLSWLSGFNLDMFTLKTYGDIWWILLVCFIGIGAFIGATGSGLSIRKHLDV